MENKLKEKLDAKKVALGTFVWSASTYIVESFGYTGLDYVILDAEHSPIDTEGVVNMVRSAKLHGLTPVIRAKDGSRSSVLKMLDLGAEALIVPNLHTIEEVKSVVDYAKYPPVGKRGFAQCRRAGYGFEKYAKELDTYLKVSNDQTLLFPMCETREFLACVEEVVAIEGVDGIFVGPYDLSLDMGIPGRFDLPEFKNALFNIAKICILAGKHPLIFSNSIQSALSHIQMGYQAPAIGIDTQMIIREYQKVVEIIINQGKELKSGYRENSKRTL